MNSKIARFSELIESRLYDYFEPCREEYKLLFDAMSYSVKSGGKRVRPLLTLLFCDACGGEPAQASHKGFGKRLERRVRPVRQARAVHRNPQRRGRHIRRLWRQRKAVRVCRRRGRPAFGKHRQSRARRPPCKRRRLDIFPRRGICGFGLLQKFWRRRNILRKARRLACEALPCLRRDFPVLHDNFAGFK